MRIWWQQSVVSLKTILILMIICWLRCTRDETIKCLLALMSDKVLVVCLNEQLSTTVSACISLHVQITRETHIVREFRRNKTSSYSLDVVTTLLGELRGKNISNDIYEQTSQAFKGRRKSNTFGLGYKASCEALISDVPTCSSKLQEQMLDTISAYSFDAHLFKAPMKANLDDFGFAIRLKSVMFDCNQEVTFEKMLLQ